MLDSFELLDSQIERVSPFRAVVQRHIRHCAISCKGLCEREATRHLPSLFWAPERWPWRPVVLRSVRWQVALVS